MSSLFRGTQLSSATSPTLVFFKSGEECSKVWRSLTRQNTHKTNEAA